MCGNSQGCKTDLVQNGIHEVARAVARERTSSAVGAVGTGSKSEDHHACRRITKARYWLRPILPVHVSAALLSTNLLAMRDQARASSAGDDLLVEDGKQRHLDTFCQKRNVNSPQRQRDTEDFGICACFGFAPDAI